MLWYLIIYTRWDRCNKSQKNKKAYLDLNNESRSRIFDIPCIRTLIGHNIFCPDNQYVLGFDFIIELLLSIDEPALLFNSKSSIFVASYELISNIGIDTKVDIFSLRRKRKPLNFITAMNLREACKYTQYWNLCWKYQ